jgi:hypothetical protein
MVRYIIMEEIEVGGAPGNETAGVQSTSSLLSRTSRIFDQDERGAAMGTTTTSPSARGSVSNWVASRQKRSAYSNFVLLSVLFSANHGCVVSCLGLATARLGGAVGANQSLILYGFYTASSLLGATKITKTLGSRNALVAGMSAYVLYVACFWLAAATATAARQNEAMDIPLVTTVAVLSGGAVGGWGAGFLWTAQGSYFVRAADEHGREIAAFAGTAAFAEESSDPPQHRRRRDATSELASIFAFVYLAEEVVLRTLSTLLLDVMGGSWTTVFAIYSAVAFVSALLMGMVRNYDDESENRPDGYDLVPGGAQSPTGEPGTDEDAAQSAPPLPSPPSNTGMSSTLRLLLRDPKMKYMAGINVLFGWTAAFLNSYVNGQVLPKALGSDAPIGLYTSWVSVVAAAGSLGMGRSCVSSRLSKVSLLMAGSLCFAGVAIPFVLVPDAGRWSWKLLLLVYTCHGLGRATFESTLKAVFADYFGSLDKEAAFANIVLQNGVASSIGYALTVALVCDRPSLYCVEYRDGSIHDVLTFELLIVTTAMLAVMGLRRASELRRADREEDSDVAQQARPLVSGRGDVA